MLYRSIKGGNLSVDATSTASRWATNDSICDQHAISGDSRKLQLHNIQLPKDMRELPKYCRQKSLSIYCLLIANCFMYLSMFFCTTHTLNQCGSLTLKTQEQQSKMKTLFRILYCFKVFSVYITTGMMKVLVITKIYMLTTSSMLSIKSPNKHLRVSVLCQFSL